MAKITDNFLNLFRVNDDDFYDDDYDDYDDYDDEPVKEKQPKVKKTREVAAEPKKEAPKRNTYKSNKVIPMRSNRNGVAMELVAIKPSSVDESREITDTLLEGKTVVLNLEGVHVDVAQRIIDFISGSCYAINGNLQKISGYIFIVSPENVDLSGDFQELFANGFDMSTFNKRY